jgi:hypothetical protein
MTKHPNRKLDEQIPLFKSQSRHFSKEEVPDTFHNTVNADPEEVAKWKKLTVTQNAKVLECFVNNAFVEFTAWEIHDLTKFFITDCRRAINTLMRSGWIEQVGEKRERKGVLNYTYRCVVNIKV